MTSNIGSQFLQGDHYDIDGALAALRAHFRPEFLNRVDDIITFHNLKKEHLKKIVEIQADRLRGMLADRQMSIEITDEAKEFVAENGYDPAYGARPIKRTLQRHVADPLALAILEGQFVDGDTILVNVNGSGLRFDKIPEILEGEVVS
jgi:ATP-dependent Clp protease ATP-binding subunit ClpB